MRQIGSIADESLAERFVDYLTTQRISATCEADEENWVIWVRDEDQLDEAREALEQFEADPQAAEYLRVERQAAELRAVQAKKRREARKNFVDVRGHWNAPLSKRAPLTMAMIVTCIGLAVLGGGFGSGPGPIDGMLMFADLRPNSEVLRTGDGLLNIRSGQVWRLLTPIFLHGGVVHLIFNMFWLYYLGGQAEPKLGKLRFAGLVVVTGVASNVVQYAFSGPAFLGMSGVVFGLFGYIWMRVIHDPTSGYQLTRQTIILVLIFFGIGFAGFFDIGGQQIANWAHAGGLGAGIILGMLPEWLSPKRPSA